MTPKCELSPCGYDGSLCCDDPKSCPLRAKIQSASQDSIEPKPEPVAPPPHKATIKWHKVGGADPDTTYWKSYRAHGSETEPPTLDEHDLHRLQKKTIRLPVCAPAASQYNNPDP